MNCPNCDNKCEEYSFDKLIIYYCINCWDFIKHDSTLCENHIPTFVKFLNNGGTMHLKKQCPNCGKLDTRYYKRDMVEDFDSLPLTDLESANKYDDIDYDKLQRIYKRYDTKRKQFQKQQAFGKFIEEHSKYLKTKEWKMRRGLVLIRDNYLCQSCLDKKATQVHHKSYRYWKNEPLFELVSVCEDCHNTITEMNRDVINFKNILGD